MGRHPVGGGIGKAAVCGAYHNTVCTQSFQFSQRHLLQLAYKGLYPGCRVDVANIIGNRVHLVASQVPQPQLVAANIVQLQHIVVHQIKAPHAGVGQFPRHQRAYTAAAHDQGVLLLHGTALKQPGIAAEQIVNQAESLHRQRRTVRGREAPAAAAVSAHPGIAGNGHIGSYSVKQRRWQHQSIGGVFRIFRRVKAVFVKDKMIACVRTANAAHLADIVRVCRHRFCQLHQLGSVGAIFRQHLFRSFSGTSGSAVQHAAGKQVRLQARSRFLVHLLCRIGRHPIRRGGQLLCQQAAQRRHLVRLFLQRTVQQPAIQQILVHS